MKILFLGLLYLRNEEKIILSKSKRGLQGATNTFQWNLLTGFDEILEDTIQIFTSLPVGTYPRNYKQLLIKSRTWSHLAGAKDRDIGYVNLLGIKQILRLHSFYREVKQWCEENPKEDLYLIAYSLYLPYLKVLAAMKKKFKNLCTCIIVPDLPNAFGFDPCDHSIKKSVKEYIGNLQYKLAKTADTFVLLTEEMINPLEIKDKPYVIVEGICNPQLLQQETPEMTQELTQLELTQPELTQLEETQPEDNTIVILYTGALNQVFGLDQLMKAFQKISQDNYQLWVCGSGDYQNEIEKVSKEDTRIKYYGYVTKDKIQKLQQKATLLINPRPNSGEYTKYSFPSKTIEYMSSRKPVLMFKLDGIPKEYDDYLFYIKENTVEGIATAILSICSIDKEALEIKGKEAYDFIVRNKNGRIQAMKILNMLQETMSKTKLMKEKLDQLYQKQEAVEKSSLILNSKEGKKKILQINITCQYGSSGRIVVEIHNFLLEMGFHSVIAYSAFRSNIKESFKIENTLENYLRRVLNRYFGKKYAHSILGTLRMIWKIKRLQPDLIHLHNIQQNSVHFPMLFKFLKKYGVPIVYTLHDCWAFTGGCYHFTELRCNGYQTGCMECKLDKNQRDLSNKSTSRIWEEKNNALHGIERLQIICVSNWLKSCAEQSYMRDLPLQVIYNGIDTYIFKPVKSEKRAELGISVNEFMILGIANQWDNKKGLNTFSRLAELLDRPYRIVLVGITAYNCPPNIIAVPRTDSIQELVELYSCADVLVNASKEETFGLVTAEAMACGTPVIAYNSTACGEVIRDDTGIILNSFNMEDLHIAIEDIRKTGKLNYSEKCINNIRKEFSKEEMLKQYLNIYEQMLRAEKLK
ncbi:MAG: glycosyltransferase [Mobilitalea sp.]